MTITRVAVAITTDASGDATAYTSPVTGFVRAIRYVPDGSVPLDTGADLTITGNTTTIPIVTVTNLGTSAVTIAPRLATASVANAAALYAAAGTAVNDLIPVCEEAIKVVVAQGGNAKKGTLYFYLG